MQLGGSKFGAKINENRSENDLNIGRHHSNDFFSILVDLATQVGRKMEPKSIRKDIGNARPLPPGPGISLRPLPPGPGGISGRKTALGPNSSRAPPPSAPGPRILVICRLA